MNNVVGSKRKPVEPKELQYSKEHSRAELMAGTSGDPRAPLVPSEPVVD